MLLRVTGWLTLLFASLSSLVAQEHPVAFRGAHLLPISGPAIESGTLIVQHGRIIGIGPSDTTPIPGDAEIHDVTGRVLMPGLIDSHSHIGGWPGFGADNSHPIQPEVRVLDAVDVRDASIQKARAGGITTVNVMPGSGHLISGQTLYLKLRDVNTIEGQLILLPDGRVAGGLKMANGTNSQRQDTLAQFPGTRARSAALVRETFIKALEYRAKVERAGADADKLPPRDLGLEAVLEAIDGVRVVQHHTHRHDDIVTVLRLQREFGFKVVLHHVSEGWKIPDEIAAADVLGCSIIVVDSPGGKLEARDMRFETAAVLERAGVQVGFHTDDPICDSRLFLRSAAFAVRGGMSREAALAGLTVNNARLLGLGDRLGTLEVGKDADFILLSGDPFSVYTQVLQTWIEGQLTFDRDRPTDRLWAEGGPGAGEPRRHYLCCFGSSAHGLAD